MARAKTHLVQSKEIATICICHNLFKMSYPLGIVGGQHDYNYWLTMLVIPFISCISLSQQYIMLLRRTSRIAVIVVVLAVASVILNHPLMIQHATAQPSIKDPNLKVEEVAMIIHLFVYGLQVASVNVF